MLQVLLPVLDLILLNPDWFLMPSGKRNILTPTANYQILATALGALHLFIL